MKHKVVSWVAGLSSLGIIVLLFGAYFKNNAYAFQLQWRWFAVFGIAAFISNIVLLAIVSRSSSRKGALYWFFLFNICGIIWEACLIMVALSATPEAAAFWQHLVAFAWSGVPTFMLFFCLAYVDDADLPGNLALWSLPLFAVIGLNFINGATGFIEFPTPVKAIEHYWGWQSQAGDLQTLIYVWAIATTIASLMILIRAYRRAVNEIARKQLRLFVIAFGQYLAIAIIGDLIINAINSNWLPPLSMFYTTSLSLIIGYGISKYGIFQINPVALSNTILHSLQEAVLGINTNMVVEFANSGAETILGYDQNVLRGRSIQKLFPEAVFADIQREIKSGKRYIEFDDTLALNISGAAVPVTISIGQVFDDRNRLAGYILVAGNISEIKKKSVELAREKASVERKVIDRTKELSEVHARLTASINSLNVGFVMTGETDDLLLINPAAHQLLGELAKTQKLAIPDKWSIKSVANVFSAGAKLEDSIKKSRERSQPFDFEEIQLAEHFVHMFLAPVTEKGQVIGTVILFEDITEEKAMARSRDEFFSIASHELRTPLTLLRGNAELIRDYYKESITSDEVMGMIGDMESSSTRLISIVNDFLDMSSLEQGKIVLRPEKFDVKALAEEITTEYQKKTEGGKISYKVETKGLTELSADRTRVRQILMNFVSNAVKFTEVGSIVISLEAMRQGIKIRVSDTGRGIKIENQGLLFHKFQQAGSSLLTRDSEGTGLGLYITKLLVTAMGGTVGLEKSEEGKGTTFYLTLPSESPVTLERTKPTASKASVTAPADATTSNKVSK